MPKTRPLTPTSLVAFTECSHTTTLDLACDERGEKRPRPSGDFFELIARKGREHEDAYLASLDQSKVTTIPGMHEHDVGEERAAALTLEAMRKGAEIIYQAHLTLPGWRGVADFLEKVPGKTDLGDWGYEPVDTKLARNDALAHHVLQLAFYADAIAAIQGSLPDHVHVEFGSGLRETVRTFEVIHYARHHRARLESFVAEPTATVAYPNQHCSICAHRATCEKQWREEDHPSFVAGIRRDHVLALRAAESPVSKLSELAALPAGTEIRDIKDHTFDEIRKQALLQIRSKEAGSLEWEHRPREAHRGFDLLPAPSPGDIYLDLEGDPVWRPSRGLVFLFGWIELNDAGTWAYRELWSHDPDEEEARYREFVRFIRERRLSDPAMHVYHYSHAETSMLGAISSVDPAEVANFEALHDEGIFVDLYKVVRQGLRVGAESYGLKTVEKLAGYVRATDLEGGSDAVILYEQWITKERQDDTILNKIADYNEHDCRATLAIADWLREHPPEGPVIEPEVWERSDKAIIRDEETEQREATADRIREQFPNDAGALLIAELLNYYERELRVGRREASEMIRIPERERLDDSRILTGLERVEPRAVLADRQREYTFPDQDHKLGRGNSRSIDEPDRFFTVADIDERARRIVLTFATKDESTVDPVALAPSENIPIGAKQPAIVTLADTLLASGRTRFACSFALVDRALPEVNAKSGDIHVEQPADGDTTGWLDDVCHRALELSGGPLSIQGPPGTGKTWLVGQIVSRLLAAGHTVMLTGPSHAVILNACKEIDATGGAALSDRALRIGPPDPTGALKYFAQKSTNDTADRALAKGFRFIAGTPWACARESIREQIDYLIIDEAGQFGLCDAVVSAMCASKGVILLGDPLQLPQVSQARHEENSGVSALGHVLATDDLVPPDRGILLTVSRRMHPDVCEFISEHIYAGRLDSLPACANQNTEEGTGIRPIPVEHHGRSAKSEEEAEKVAEIVKRLLNTNWTDKDGNTRKLGEDDIMVVAPYNSHVRRVRDELRADPAMTEIRVGTVDKFQGGEAPVVIYTMATSSEDDLPHDMAFLFSRNRLNVAISRAQGLAFLVASPKLLDAGALSIDQMRILSTICAAARPCARRANAPAELAEFEPFNADLGEP